MKIVAALVKENQVIDTYTFEVPSQEDFAEVAKKAFAYFRDRHPHMTLQTEVMIAFRSQESGNQQ
jgi:hypothetical protein